VADAKESCESAGRAVGVPRPAGIEACDGVTVAQRI